MYMGHHLFYGRHFSLLLCAIALLAAGLWRQPHALTTAFASGALHSSMVAATLRTPALLGRKLLFVALAAALSMLSAMLTLYGNRYVGGFPGMLGLRLLVTLSAGLGAVSYAVLVRHFWVADLTSLSMVSIPLGCMLATFGVLQSGAFLSYSGGLGLVACWWLAFSAGLWYHDRPRSLQRRVAER
jgi:hypothetical protein